MSIALKLMNIQQTLSAPKGQRNKFGNYNYRSCEDILEAVKPALKENGCVITLTDEIVIIGERVYVMATARLLCIETKEELYTFGYARESLTKKGMDESQITGATSSYARKYALNGLLLIDDNKDADHDSYGREPITQATVPQVSLPVKATSPKPTPVPTPAPAPAPIRSNPVSDNVLLTENVRKAIIANFDNIGIEIWNLEERWKSEEKWTMKDRREMLSVFTKIQDSDVNYSVANFLSEK